MKLFKGHLWAMKKKILSMWNFFDTIFFFPIESFESPPQPLKKEIFLAEVPSEFPRHTNDAEFQGTPILHMKNFENNQSSRDVIYAINQIIRQKSNLANQHTHLENASEDTQLNRTRITIRYIQNITIYQNPTENTKWFLLAAIVILLGGFLAFSSRGRLYK